MDIACLSNSSYIYDLLVICMNRFNLSCIFVLFLYTPDIFRIIFIFEDHVVWTAML